MNLILWRHAEAEDHAPGGDAERRLSERGHKQAARMAAWLTQRLPEETCVLASPAVRTRQTAAALGRSFALEPRLFTDCGVAEHLDAIADNEHHASLLLVGHQPTLGQLAARLMCGQAQPWSVKKGAIWWLALEGRGQPARLICMLDPKHL